MIQLDPEIMKRSLPPDIHATIDQVTSNVNAAVDKIVDGFIKKAQDAADRFQKGDFTEPIAKALEQSKQELSSDLASLEKRLADLATASAAAQSLAQNAGQNATALTAQIAGVAGAAAALKPGLSGVCTKVDH